MNTAAQGVRRIKAAAAVTAAAKKQIAAVCAMLGDDLPINSCGVYVDKHAVVNNIAAARNALDVHLRAIQSCPWPSGADYKDTDAPEELPSYSSSSQHCS